MNLISIIIVNWNGKKWLEKCLDSLRAQTYKNFEIIFVDNASTDDSVEFVEKNYPEVKIVKSKKNLGFAGGNNLGIKNAQGEYILLLNNDTWVESNFFERIVEFYGKNKYDVVAPTEGYYDGTKRDPYVMLIDFFGHCVGVHNTNHDPFYLSGACLIFSKKLYEETYGLDNDFFMYFEEIDWFWRLHLSEKNIFQISDSFVYHAGAGSTGSGTKYNSFLWRNQNTLQMLLKNYAWYNLLWVLPVYFLQNIFEIIVFMIFLKPKIAWSYIEGWWFNIKNLKKILKKRRWVQKNRKVSDRKIMKKMYWGFGKLHHLLTFIKEKKI